MIDKELTNRQKQAIATKQKLYDTVMRLGEKKNFADIRVVDICSEANVSVGTFYHYYPSVSAVFQEQYQAYDKYIVEAINNDSKNCVTEYDCILRLFELKYEYVSNSGVQMIVRQYSGQFAQIESANSVFYSKERVTYKTLINLLISGQKKGDFRLDDSPEFIANAMLIYSRGITIDWALQNGSYDLKERGLQYIRFMLDKLVKSEA